MSELRILADGLRFPEGPIWLPDGSVVLVEIAAGQITKVAADGRKTVIARPGGGPNGIAMGPGGQIYCCNNGGFIWHEEPDMLRPVGVPPDYQGGRIEVIDPASGAVRVLYDRCGDHKLKGPNDLIFAPKGSPGEGGFWFTDLGKVRARDRDHGGVYWAAADGSKIVEAAFPIFGGANGVTLSPDGRTLYVAETETGRLSSAGQHCHDRSREYLRRYAGEWRDHHRLSHGRDHPRGEDAGAHADQYLLRRPRPEDRFHHPLAHRQARGYRMG